MFETKTFLAQIFQTLIRAAIAVWTMIVTPYTVSYETIRKM